MSNEFEFLLEHFFFSYNYSVSEVGFFFGAGSSKDAGYPLTWELTRDILQKLDSPDLDLIREILRGESLELNIENGTPDIEQINDFILQRKIENPDQKVEELESKIKKLLIQEILSVKNEELKHHTSFIQSLYKRNNSGKGKVWIYTTNYDLLFENAAGLSEIVLENGFSGSSPRFFDPIIYSLIRGDVKNQKFHQQNILTINLLKLHGSIDWHLNGGKVFQSSPLEDSEKHLILPNRKKMFKTLESPYNQLFRVASESMGGQCKYIVCCGHSFRDEHINETLFIPKLKENKIRVMALFDKLPDNLGHLTKYYGFNYITSEEVKFNDKQFSCRNNLWKFSEFVKFLNANLA